MAEPIHLPFRLWTLVGRRMHKFSRICQVAPMCPHGRTCCRHLSNNTEPSVYGGDAPYVKLLWPPVFGHAHLDSHTDSQALWAEYCIVGIPHNTAIWILFLFTCKLCCYINLFWLNDWLIARTPCHHTTTILWPFFRDHPGEPVPEENFWTLWCKGRLTEADSLTIRLGANPSWLTSAHLHHPPIFFNRPDALRASQPTASKHWRQLAHSD